jgi:hypothetical protein
MFRQSLPKIALTLAVLMAVAGFVQAPLNAQGSRYSLTLNNVSGFHIYRIYMSSSENGQWGPDQLGAHALVSGGSYTIYNIPPGEYDIKFVDADGDVCRLLRVNVFRNTAWDLTRTWLLGCEFKH